ncbi:hypothetical protein LUZ60_008268 [Juncus effusus]|nr:hypothetical protein LUZ60_008268 [Juncus effusus]
MAWFNSLGGFQDLAGAVNKISESVKNIEKNFDTALGFEEKNNSESDEASGSWGAMPEFMAFMQQKEDENAEKSTQSENSSSTVSKEAETISTKAPSLAKEETAIVAPPLKEKEKEEEETEPVKEAVPTENIDHEKNKANDEQEESSNVEINVNQSTDVGSELAEKEDSEVKEESETGQESVEESEGTVERETSVDAQSEEINHERETDNVENEEVKEDSEPTITITEELNNNNQEEKTVNNELILHSVEASNVETKQEQSEVNEGEKVEEKEEEKKEKKEEGKIVTSREVNESGSDSEIEKLRKEMKMMEAALQGAARQAQAKADVMTKLMNENDQLKSTIEDLKRKSSMESEVESLKEEYHQRVSSLERKVYALTKERDTLRREQNKKSDAAALLKEKDEIITQVMAEGEELSKKQAAQEATIRKLRAQIRELEEEKQRLNSKLQVEEAKAESVKRDKSATEKLLQETIEKNQAELNAQKEFYTNALNAAKEAESFAEARANNEAKVELETLLHEAGEKEGILVQTIEELRHAITRKEQEAAFKEEMSKRDLDDIQKRYQASEMRYNELVTQVPESTRPLLRQIEAMQETAARRAEAWAGVERSLNSRLQEAEAKAAAAEENERSLNERLSQCLSRITILETQITCLRTEQTQLSRSLEKERQRASESRQEYLAAKEEAATQEGRAKQLDDEIRELRSKHKKEVQELGTHRELLEKELERERAARAELEKTASDETHKLTNQGHNNNIPMRKLSSAGSLNSIEESHFLQASLELNDQNALHLERRMSADGGNNYFLKSMTPSAFEAALRQKDGELASYMSRLASLESIRDSLAEELVKLTEQCEKLKIEAATLPGVRAELEALRQRHTAALELMGERDEELEELRADIVDLKEMYREQVDLLVNKIQMLGSSA